MRPKRVDESLSMRRRSFLKSGLSAGGLTGFGLSLPELFSSRARAQAADSGTSGRAKSCILLYMTGGPAQQETFDMKPKANQGYRGDFNPIETTVGGMQVCEHLPMMAGVAEHFSVIRSTFHNSNTHGIGVHYNMTGLKNAPRSRGEPQMDRVDPPCVGGVIRQLRGDRNGLPASVHLPVRIGDQNNFQWGGQHAGFLGQEYDPLTLIDENWTPGTLPASFLPPKGVGLERLRQRAQLLGRVEGRQFDNSEVDSPELYKRARTRALSILQSDSVWKAFLLDEEKASVIERYGDNKFCLLYTSDAADE